MKGNSRGRGRSLFLEMFIGNRNRVCYQCSCELKLKDSVYWEQMNYGEINIDSSNGQNSLEPKPSRLGLAHFLNIVIRIRNK